MFCSVLHVRFYFSSFLVINNLENCCFAFVWFQIFDRISKNLNPYTFTIFDLSLFYELACCSNFYELVCPVSKLFSGLLQLTPAYSTFHRSLGFLGLQFYKHYSTCVSVLLNALLLHRKGNPPIVCRPLAGFSGSKMEPLPEFV